MKAIVSVILIVVALLHCGTVSADSAENYWVLGSYKSQSAAKKQATMLAKDLGVDLQQQTALVGAVTYHRLLVRELDIDGEGNERLQTLGIEPWLITLKDESAADVATVAAIAAIAGGPADSGLILSDQYQLNLVGAFSEIDQALNVERRLAAANIPVRGEAKLIGGKVMHRVWVGPINEQSTDWGKLKQQLRALGLAVTESRPATKEEAAYAIRSVQEESSPQKQKTEVAVAPSGRYPANFNLARLPEKRPPLPVVP